MNGQLVNLVSDTVHTIGFVLLGAAILLICIGLIRPTIFKKVLFSFSTRPYILVSGVFACFVFATVIVATQPHQTALDSSSTKQTLEAATFIEQTPATEGQTKDIQTKKVDVMQAIPFTKKEQPDAAIPTGQTKQTQVGVDGQKKLTYDVTYIDGQETARTLSSETIMASPVPEITAIGTGPAPAEQLAPVQQKPEQKPQQPAPLPKPLTNAAPKITNCKDKKKKQKSESRLVICLP